MRTEEIGRSAVLGTVVSADLAKDGTVYVLDYTGSQLLHFSAEGRLMWRAGRKGQGPGEFIRPYRVAARDDGGAIVYDGATQLVSFFSRDGKIERSGRLSIFFAQVDDLLDMPSGELLVVGAVRALTGAPPAAIHSSMHVFAPDLSHRRSFGPLPDAEDPAILRFWGVGHASPAADGRLLFVRKLPYEVYVFDRHETLSRRIPVGVPVNARPDDFISISSAPEHGYSGLTFRLTNKDVPAPARAVVLSPRLFATGLLSKRRKTIDVIDSQTGALVASCAMPPGWQMLIGYNASRSALWSVAEVNDEPVLLRQTIVLQK
ncbi:MAG: hypothetical protein WKG32_15685 [Gemmatimonadaceae bacterium]